MFSSHITRVTLLAWVITVASPVVAGTLTVNNLGDAGDGTLRSAIEQAVSGDTIDFQAGLEGTITLDSPLPVLDFDLSIEGPGADVIIVSGANQNRVFFIESGATVAISGLSIAAGFHEFKIEDTESGIGGAILNLGTLFLEDCVVRDSFAEFGGGGISNDEAGILKVSRCAIAGNSTGADGAGGGIENFSGQVEVVSSTISGNQADFGGGIDNIGTLTVVNSTVSGNSAIGFGGGINNVAGEVALVFSTVAGNSAEFGAGIFNDDHFTARNSLVVNNLAGGDCDNDDGISFDASGDNLATDLTCPGFAQTTAEALGLGPLADNGGPTRTHALGNASVAINAVDDCTDIDGITAIVQDQRGVTRPQGTSCDIGAFEFDSHDVIFSDRFEEDQA